MAFQPKSTVVYNGLIIQEIAYESAVGAMKDKQPLVAPTNISYPPHWRVVATDSRKSEFIVTPSEEAAKKLIDSGEAMKQLNEMRSNAKR